MRAQDRLHFLKAFSSRPNRYECAAWLVEHASLTTSSTVLEVGCAQGDASRWIAQTTGAIVYGIDRNPNLICSDDMYKNAKPGPSRVFIERGDAAHLRFAPATFDAVLCEACLSHVRDKARCVGELRRVIDSRGCIVVADFICIDDAARSRLADTPFKGVMSRCRYLQLFDDAGFICLEEKTDNKTLKTFLFHMIRENKAAELFESLQWDSNPTPSLSYCCFLLHPKVNGRVLT